MLNRLWNHWGIKVDDKKRPRSLYEAARRGGAGGDKGASLREFLDSFYLENDPSVRQTMIDQEPELHDEARSNAYYAAAAEHLAFQYGLNVPKWTQSKERFLDMPYFPIGLESLKATMLKESPLAFRRRMIFVEKNPLYRPRKDYVESDELDTTGMKAVVSYPETMSATPFPKGPFVESKIEPEEDGSTAAHIKKSEDYSPNQ